MRLRFILVRLLLVFVVFCVGVALYPVAVRFLQDRLQRSPRSEVREKATAPADKWDGTGLPPGMSK